MATLFRTLLMVFMFGKTGLNKIEGIEKMGVNIA